MLLDWPSVERLTNRRKGALPEAVVLASDLAAVADRIGAVPLVVSTRQMLGRAVAEQGLTLTATGNLSRADVRALFDALSWPDYDKAHVLEFNKVLNEPDVHPVAFTRTVVEAGKLLRRRGSRLMATRPAKALLGDGQEAALFRLLIEVLLWRVNLAYFDRASYGHWPQDHIGVVLWALASAAADWRRSGDLVEFCTMPDPGAQRDLPDHATWAFEARVLRPLTALGLLDVTADESSPEPRRWGPRLWRKSSLYDRVLSFDVRLERPVGTMH